ncbi:MAG: sulfurtransferase TusA family protein [Sphingomonadales bacterium]
MKKKVQFGDRMRAIRELDARGLLGPMPVLKTRRLLQNLEAGDVLEVRATDDASVHDFPAFCTSAGHELLMAEDKDGVLTFRIRKGGEMDN